MRTSVSKLTRLGLILLAIPALILRPQRGSGTATTRVGAKKSTAAAERFALSVPGAGHWATDRKRWLEAEIAALNATRDPAEEKRLAAERRKQAVVKMLASLKAKANEAGATGS